MILPLVLSAFLAEPSAPQGVPEPTPAETTAPTSATGPTSIERVRITLIATPDLADTIAAALDPRLGELGMEASYDRCEDFSCVEPPRPAQDARAIVVVDGAKALVVVTRGSSTTVVVDELTVTDPPTEVDLEALGHAVTRSLISPPARLWTDWHAAERLGRWLAPPSAPPVPAVETPRAPTPVAPPPLAFSRGPYVELGAGTVTSPGGAFSLGLAARAGGGFLFEGPEGSRLRAALGGRASYFGTMGSDASGTFAGEARLALGFATRTLMPSLRLGLGPAVTYRDRGGAEVTGAASMGGGIDGRVGKHLAIGIEIGVTLDVLELDPVVYGTFGATWWWDVPRAGRSKAR